MITKNAKNQLKSILKNWSGLFLFMYSSWASAHFNRSSLQINPEVKTTLKYPNSLLEGQRPVISTDLVVEADKLMNGNGLNYLLPYITPSPYQDEAGSCLYMSLTGIAEWWLGKLDPKISWVPNGDIDLSERYLMNIAGIEEGQNGVPNWKTDSILLFNTRKHAVQNKYYPFTKGYYKDGKAGGYSPSSESDPKSRFGTGFNWINQLYTIKAGHVALPRFERKIIFADPESNQWNTGVTPKDIVAKIKNTLKNEKAPILVIYNHYGYWHANYIIGYDDTIKHDCSFVKNFIPYMLDKAQEYKVQASQAQTQTESQHFKKREQRYRKFANNAQQAFDRIGGCSGEGVFYVRDSLYPDDTGPLYSYGLEDEQHSEYYVKKVVLREFEWINTMANHLTLIKIQR